MVKTESLSRKEKNYGKMLTLSTVLGSLLRELPTTVVPATNEITHGTISDIRGPKFKEHEFEAKIIPIPLTGEPLLTNFSSIKIDGKNIAELCDLAIIGMDKDQIDLLENNAKNLALIYKIQKKFGYGAFEKPVIMDVLANVFSTKIEHMYGKPGNIFKMLSSIPPEAAFILTDALGNIQGPYGSSLGYTMVGKDAEQYHSVLVGAENGVLPVPFVKIDNVDFKTYGQLSIDIDGEVGDLLRQGYIPIHPYNHANYLGKYKISDVKLVDCFVLMSKRSLIPVGYDFQIKTSFGAQVLALDRDIPFSQATNGVENSSVLNHLANKGLLPDNCYIIEDQFVGQVEGDNHTTYVIRKGLSKLTDNNNAPLPKGTIPITIASLLSKNILSPVSLLQDFKEAGGDPVQLVKDIIQLVVKSKLDLMIQGFNHESHAQNSILLIDPISLSLKGMILRDIEGAKIDRKKMHELGIPFIGNTNLEEHAASCLPEDNPKLYAELVTGSLHRFVLTGIISPLILSLHHINNIDLGELIEFVKTTYIDWWKSSGQTYKDYRKYISPGFISSNGTLSALHVKSYGSVRTRPDHPFIPTHEEMKSILSTN